VNIALFSEYSSIYLLELHSLTIALFTNYSSIYLLEVYLLNPVQPDPDHPVGPSVEGTVGRSSCRILCRSMSGNKFRRSSRLQSVDAGVERSSVGSQRAWLRPLGPDVDDLSWCSVVMTVVLAR